MANSYEETLLEAEDRMEKAVHVLEGDLRGIRTGRASPALVEGIRVEYYGTPTPLQQLAAISVPEPRLLVVRPFDPTSLKEIERALQKSDLGVAPSNDGKVIRLALPPLSEEQRRKLAARVKDVAEQTRVALRNVRRDALKQTDAAEDKRDLTEDEARKLRDEIQETIKRFEGRVSEVLDRKTKEILEG
jgi:ribosome recycling factor